MTEKPRLDAIYAIELCSGERRCWQYRGTDAHAQVWWRDVESGREFSEASLMYTWWIVASEDRSPESPKAADAG